MLEKLKDEYEAMIICREKVEQRGLPMRIVDAEYQWCGVSSGLRDDEADPGDIRDRRKLTFYFKADKRVDFRDLTKENFRIFKVSLGCGRTVQRADGHRYSRGYGCRSSRRMVSLCHGNGVRRTDHIRSVLRLKIQDQVDGYHDAC